MSLTYGELFAGYDGLGLGVRSILGGTTSWFAEFDKAPSKILAHHYPDVPNLGDVTKVDWHSVPKVDVITGGSPCQDLSHAGKRAGMKAGTRSGLWASMCDAIDIIRPRLVVWENVRGALSAEADSELEHCPGCMGGAGDGGPVLRALGRVLGDLAELGFDARWYGLRAADVGAPHGRFRIFLFAQPADADLPGLEGLADQAGAAQAGRHGHAESGAGGPDMTLLPTPTAAPSEHSPKTSVRRMGSGVPVSVSDAVLANWGDYGPAIARWEALTRPAPAPTEPGAKGSPRLSPRFVEWMMGLPEGWVDVEGVSRNEQLKALGNGVVPAQVAAATRAFLVDSAGDELGLFSLGDAS